MAGATGLVADEFNRQIHFRSVRIEEPSKRTSDVPVGLQFFPVLDEAKVLA